MSGLEEVYDGGGRWRAVVRAVLLLAGGLLAAVGVVATTASLVAGFGLPKERALEVSVLFGGALLVAAFLAPFARSLVRGRSRTPTRSRVLAAVGTALAVAGLALFRTTLPANWSGDVAALPSAAVGTYALGLLAALGAGLTAEADSDSASAGRDSDGFGSVEDVVLAADDRSPSSALGDGGETDDDLTFPGDEDG